MPIWGVWRNHTATVQWARVKDDYRRHLVSQGSTKQTVRSYVYNVDYYARWCEGADISLFGASGVAMRAYVAEELTHRARSTAMNRLLACRSFYRYLNATNRRKGDPTAGIPVRRDQQEPPRPYTESELRRLLAAAHNPRDYALILFALGSGARRTEITGLNIEDVDWIERAVLIRGKGGKERKVAPGEAALQAVWRYLGERRDGPMWLTNRGTPMQSQDAYKIITRIGKAAGVVRPTMHRFRVTMICGLLEAGADAIAVSVVAGHSLKMVQRYQRSVEAQRALAQQRKHSLADRLVG